MSATITSSARYRDRWHRRKDRLGEGRPHLQAARSATAPRAPAHIAHRVASGATLTIQRALTMEARMENVGHCHEHGFGLPAGPPRPKRCLTGSGLQAGAEPGLAV